MIQSSAGYPVRLWIDPARGFATVKREAFRSDTGELMRFHSYDVLEMREFEEGVWVPVHVLYRQGKEIVGKEISVNGDIPDDVFTIRFPVGTVVYDGVGRLTYLSGLKLAFRAWYAAPQVIAFLVGPGRMFLGTLGVVATTMFVLLMLRKRRRRKAG